MYESSTKETSGCASNLLPHEDLGHLRRPIIGIYKTSSIMKNSHQYMKVTTQETLHHEDHGATLKHKCGKRIVALPFSPFLSFIFLGLLFFGLFSLFYLTLDNALIMKIITLLFTYNSRITTRYLEQNMTLCECHRRYTGMCNESRATCIKNDERWLCHKCDVNYMIMYSNMTMTERVIINRTVESCMAIYLRMAMEMP